MPIVLNMFIIIVIVSVEIILAILHSFSILAIPI